MTIEKRILVKIIVGFSTYYPKGAIIEVIVSNNKYYYRKNPKYLCLDELCVAYFTENF